ncbi:MAG: AI-2E family transporter [Patescibacteria group bacterium]|nr:AI-2E family transporter [Patescibacteria group bacterium]
MKITIDTWSILKILAIFALIGFLYLLRNIVMLVFSALFLAALIHPAAEYLSRKKIPKGVTVIAIYILLGGLAVMTISLLLPVFIEQSSHILESFGRSWETLSGGVHWLQDISTRYGFNDNLTAGLQSLQEQLAGLAGGLVGRVTDVISGFIGIIAVMVMTYYMVVNEKDARRVFHNFVPEEYQESIASILKHVQDKIGRWLIGQISLCLIIGLMYYVGLLLVGVKGALVFAVFGGFMELIPYLGAILGAIPPIILALSDSPFRALLTFAVIIFIQQSEGHVIVPKVMEKAVGLNPLISILALLVGAELFGLLGALFAIPVATAVSAILSELYRQRAALRQASNKTYE